MCGLRGIHVICGMRVIRVIHAMIVRHSMCYTWAALQPDKGAWFAVQHDSADTELMVSVGDKIPRVERMQVLGTVVEAGGDPMGAAVAHRTQRAWACCMCCDHC